MKIELVPYDLAWPEMFAEERNRLQTLLAGLSPRIEHIGSTSVVGLMAKPVIDILVGLKSAKDLDRVADLILRDPHYVYMRVYNAVMPRRRMFIRISDAEQLRQLPQIVDEKSWAVHQALLTREYHIHNWEEADEDYQRHLRFRDHIRRDAEDRQAYQDLKLRLSQQEWESGSEYAGAKTKFIRAIEAKTRLAK